MDRVKDLVCGDNMNKMMLGIINCWNSTDIFKSRDFYFTRLGVLPWHKEDDATIRKQIQEYDKIAKRKEDIAFRDSQQKRNQG